MRGFITGHDIANTVRMAHSQRPVVFLLVEGTTDLLCLRPLIEPATCDILVCHNRSNALAALDLLDQAREAGFITVVDADFDCLEGRCSPSSNCIFTEYHDLVMVLFVSPALDRVVAELASAEKLLAFEAHCGEPLRNALPRRAIPLGYLRWLNHRLGARLDFKDLDLERFTDAERLEMDQQRLVEVVAQRSQQGREIGALVRQHETLMKDERDARDVACGHDVVALLSLALRRSIGSQRAGDVRVDVLERQLRLAFDRAAFRATALYRELRGWEGRNPGWRILQDEGWPESSGMGIEASSSVAS